MYDFNSWTADMYLLDPDLPHVAPTSPLRHLIRDGDGAYRAQQARHRTWHRLQVQDYASLAYDQSAGRSMMEDVGVANWRSALLWAHHLAALAQSPVTVFVTAKPTIFSGHREVSM